jgi:uncharacterized membrane protein
MLLLLLVLTAGVAQAKKPVKPPPPPPPPAEDPYYTIHTLSAWGNGFYGIGWELAAINESGQMAGKAYTASLEGRAVAWFPADTDADGEPDTWYRDTNGNGVNDLLVDIGVLGGTTSFESYTRDINDSGMVVGGSTHDEHPDGSPGQNRAFLFRDLNGNRAVDAGELQALGALVDGKPSNAHGINNLGQVIGISYARAFLITPSDVDGDGDLDWFDGTDPEGGKNDLMIDLGDYNEFSPLAINDAGQIVGYGYSTNDYSLLTPADMDGDGALEWWWDADADGLNDLLTLVPGLVSGETGTVIALNETGEMAGWARDSQGKEHALLWTTSLVPVDLGALPDETDHVAWALNDVGQVVGQAETWTTRRNKPPVFVSSTGFLHEEGSMKDLLALVVNPTGITRLLPRAINDLGFIAGMCKHTDGSKTVFVAVPQE